MRYDFYYSDELGVHRGEIEGSEPRIAILSAARRCTDILDECEGALAPTVTVERGTDGAFNATIDTHGLGDLYVRLEGAK